jgi:hypothetical protein
VSTTAQAGAVEIMQMANEAAFISGVAGTMISMTLIVRLISVISVLFACLNVLSTNERSAGWEPSDSDISTGFDSAHLRRNASPTARTDHSYNTFTIEFLMQGLAVGFVLLRVESLVEEGKI